MGVSATTDCPGAMTSREGSLLCDGAGAGAANVGRASKRVDKSVASAQPRRRAAAFFGRPLRCWKSARSSTITNVCFARDSVT